MHSLSISLHAEVQNISSGLFLWDAGEKYPRVLCATHLKASLEWRALILAVLRGTLQRKRWGSVTVFSIHAEISQVSVLLCRL